jgi:diguanylate cyclase (GGDEF)-like protein
VTGEPQAREGLDHPVERLVAGRMIGALWIVGGVSGMLWYLVPGADTAHLALGLVFAGLSTCLGIACVLAPWRRMSPRWIYAAAGVSLIVIPLVMAINGGADSPTVLYLFLATVIFGYYLPTRAAIIFLSLGVLVPATPLLYDSQAREATYVAELFLTAPIYAGVGLTVVLAKRQLVGLRNQARLQALKDPLTGLANRRALTNALRDASASAGSTTQIGLLMIDLDDFKAINTAQGHVGGDRVLRQTAVVLERVTRQDDLVARLGGDEFAILVSGASENDLGRLCQRIVVAVREVKLDGVEGNRRLTASVGFAMLAPGAGIDAFLDHADSVLRRAKSAGKDRWDAHVVTPLPTGRRAGDGEPGGDVRRPATA